ncbi:MAG: sialate O-acetylesterase [Spirochaetota bacterium]
MSLSNHDPLLSIPAAVSKKVFHISLAVAALASAVFADVRVSKLFSDNMMLQQDMDIRFWGYADDGESITVSIVDADGRTLASGITTAAGGRWKLSLAPRKAGGPYEVRITGRNIVTIKNVLIGEVWLAGGQSNMWYIVSNAMPGGNPAIEGAGELIRAATNTRIRYFFDGLGGTNEPALDVYESSKWKETSPGNVIWFSAVGYVFAERLARARNVPVGIIGTAVGGTSMQWWMPREALAADPEFALYAQKPWNPNLKRIFEQSTALYNAMIAPLTGFPMRGVIWYQGENNARGATDDKLQNAVHFYRLFTALIRSWRSAWNDEKLPFLFVQLAPYGKHVDADPNDIALAYTRDAQLKSWQTTSNTAMAVITDCGDKGDIHPLRKIPVGERLSAAARAVVYGEKIEYSGPVFRSMKIDGARIVIAFDHANGLIAKDGSLTGIEISGPDGVFMPANAVIEGAAVRVSADAIAAPRYVRFGWANYPEPVLNLYNSEGFPASPFSTAVTIGEYVK